MFNTHEEIFWKTFRNGKHLEALNLLVIAADQDNAFKKLVEAFKDQFPDMPATVPVHEKFVYHNGEEWVLIDEEEEAVFPVFVVDPSWKPKNDTI